MLEAVQLELNVWKGENEIFIFDGCRVEQSLKDRLKGGDNENLESCQREKLSRFKHRLIY